MLALPFLDPFFAWARLGGAAAGFTAVDAYVMSLSCASWRRHYLDRVFPSAVFDAVEVARRRAWSILDPASARPGILALPAEMRQLEYYLSPGGVGHVLLSTTPGDWAARKGHLRLLQWLAANAADGLGLCTSMAMDFAARNGHLDVLEWLHRVKPFRDPSERGYTHAAADWAASKGHLRVLQWLVRQHGGPVQPAGADARRRARRYCNARVAAVPRRLLQPERRQFRGRERPRRRG